MTWLAGMEGIPTDYRHMEGYGVNTFTLINGEGKETYVKFHWRPKEGKPQCQWMPGHLQMFIAILTLVVRVSCHRRLLSQDDNVCNAIFRSGLSPSGMLIGA